MGVRVSRGGVAEAAYLFVYHLFVLLKVRGVSPRAGDHGTARAPCRQVLTDITTSGLKVLHPTPSDSERHRGAPRNSLSLRSILRWRDALLSAPVSAWELVTAPNLHQMTNGFPHFSAFGLVAQCNFVHWTLRASSV